ncbi:reverse transcriptase domain, reverse transcriptase zinc-binding domain protein [Tanacetum coccineum]
MLHVPSTSDLLVWKDRNGLLHSFSVGVVWNSIRTREVEVEWAKVVWFTHCIHRHAFFLWLVIKQKLKTQDVLRQWDVSATSNLNMFRCLSSKSRSVKGVLPKLVLATLVYFIWQERNFWLFQKKKWSKEQVCEVILSTIRLKLLSFHYKKFKNVEVLFETWKLPKLLVRDEDKS